MLNNVFLITCVLLVVVSLIFSHSDQKRQLGDFVFQAKQSLSKAADDSLLSVNAYKNKQLLPAYFSILRALTRIETLTEGRSIVQLSHLTSYDVQKMYEEYRAFGQVLEDEIATRFNLKESFSHMHTLAGLREEIPGYQSENHKVAHR